MPLKPLPSTTREQIWAIVRKASAPHDLQRLAELLDQLAADHAAQVADLYTERTQLVALIARLALEHECLVGVGKDPVEIDAAWQHVVFIELPTGQVTWHVHADEIKQYFNWCPPWRGDPWDGHTTAQKYARVVDAAVDENEDLWPDLLEES
jgi:hypothetical protein